MIALAALFLSAALAYAVREWARVKAARLAFDAARYEARKPVPPHEDLQRKVDALERRMDEEGAAVRMALGIDRGERG